MKKAKKEIFKDIPKYEGVYQISDLGRVKSLPKEWVAGTGGVRSHNGKFLKPVVGGNGYFNVALYREGKRKTKNAHQLVAIAFLNHTPNGYNGLIVDHIDNDKSNNNVNNLQLISTRENLSKDRKGGTSKYAGVCWDKKDNKWRSSISINGKKKYLGLFKCELEASAAYQRKLKEILTNQIPKTK